MPILIGALLVRAGGPVLPNQPRHTAGEGAGPAARASGDQRPGTARAPETGPSTLTERRSGQHPDVLTEEHAMPEPTRRDVRDLVYRVERDLARVAEVPRDSRLDIA